MRHLAETQSSAPQNMNEKMWPGGLLEDGTLPISFLGHQNAPQNGKHSVTLPPDKLASKYALKYTATLYPQWGSLISQNGL